jgi:hypothetical protein
MTRFGLTGDDLMVPREASQGQSLALVPRTLLHLLEVGGRVKRHPMA